MYAGSSDAVNSITGHSSLGSEAVMIDDNCDSLDDGTTDMSDGDSVLDTSSVNGAGDSDVNSVGKGAKDSLTNCTISSDGGRTCIGDALIGGSSTCITSIVDLYFIDGLSSIIVRGSSVKTSFTNGTSTASSSMGDIISVSSSMVDIGDCCSSVGANMACVAAVNNDGNSELNPKSVGKFASAKGEEVWTSDSVIITDAGKEMLIVLKVDSVGGATSLVDEVDSFSDSVIVSSGGEFEYDSAATSCVEGIGDSFADVDSSSVGDGDFIINGKSRGEDSSIWSDENSVAADKIILAGNSDGIGIFMEEVCSTLVVSVGDNSVTNDKSSIIGITTGACNPVFDDKSAIDCGSGGD